MATDILRNLMFLRHSKCEVNGQSRIDDELISVFISTVSIASLRDHSLGAFFFRVFFQWHDMVVVVSSDEIITPSNTLI